MTTTLKEQAPEVLRTHFEALASDPSFKLSRSRRGTYVNPAVARDWKWFQLGASQAQQTAPAGTPDCDTPNYCSSVQRCTAHDEQRSKPAPKQEAQEPAFWMNEKGHTWSHSDWKQFPKHRAKYPIPLYPHLPALQPSTAQAAPAAGAVAGWLPVHFNGCGFYGAPLKTEAEANQYIEQVHQSSDSVTLIARPFAWVAAPTPAAQADNQPAPTLDESTPGEWFVRKLVKDGELRGCFVAAPDYLGMPYDAEILGDDEYRDKPESDETSGMRRRLADCELIVAAVKHYRAARKQGGV